MAYTKAPMQDTYQTKTVPLLWDWDNRSPLVSKDTEAINVVWDLIPNKQTGDNYWEATKREGLELFSASSVGSPSTGVFYWEQGDVVVAAGTFGVKFYTVDGTNTITTATVIFNSSNYNHIGFTNFLYEDGTSDLIISDGQNLAKVNTGGVVTSITDPDRPPFHRPYPVFLDGYLFLADDKGNIQNSDNNNPTAWSAGNFISAEAYADRITALARHGVYIVAFGTSSMEFFYDAANPTGTPLAKYTASTPRIGYVGGLASQGDSLFFMGRPANGYPAVCKLTGLKLEVIDTPTSNRQTSGALSYPFGQLQSDYPGHIFNINGHILYVWTGNNLRTYALDTDTGLWSRLVTTLSNTTGFNPSSSTYVEHGVGTAPAFTLVSFASTGLFAFRPTIYQDNGSNFTATFVTRNLDFGTRRRKFGSRALLVCDQTPSTSLVDISWTDDDYQTYTSPRSVDISNVYPVLYSMGMFLKRAYKVTYTDNFPMRFQGIEVDYNQGQA